MTWSRKRWQTGNRRKAGPGNFFTYSFSCECLAWEPEEAVPRLVSRGPGRHGQTRYILLTLRKRTLSTGAIASLPQTFHPDLLVSVNADIRPIAARFASRTVPYLPKASHRSVPSQGLVRRFR